MLNGRSTASKIANEKIVKHLLDLIILCKLLEGPTYGYDLIKFIHVNFDTFLSPSTVYPVLYDLETRGIIRSGRDGKKKIYTLAEPSMARGLVEDSVGAHMTVLKLANDKFTGKNAMVNLFR